MQFLAAAALMLCSCGGENGTTADTSVSAVSPSTVTVSASSSTTTSDSEATSPESTAAPSRSTPETAATVPGCVPQCRRGKLITPGPLPEGEYTTVNFFDGALTVTVDDGWESQEDSTGEFALQHGDLLSLYFWLDPYPVTGDCETTNCRVEDVTGAAGLEQWLRENPDLVVEDDAPLVLDGIEFTSIAIATSDSAANVDPGCPAEPCVNVISYPEWDYPFAITADHFMRLNFADVDYGGETHLFVIAADTPPPWDEPTARANIALTSIDIPAEPNT